MFSDKVIQAHTPLDRDGSLNIIKKCPGHYGAWNYLANELEDVTFAMSLLEFIREFTEEEPKVYQAWNCRRRIISNLKSSPLISILIESELASILTALRADNKNHHAWEYRQWLFSEIPKLTASDGCLLLEDNAIRELCRADIVNNSSLNYRLWMWSKFGLTDFQTDLATILSNLQFNLLQPTESLVIFVGRIYTFYLNEPTNGKIAFIECWVNEIYPLLKSIVLNDLFDQCVYIALYRLSSERNDIEAMEKIAGLAYKHYKTILCNAETMDT